MSTLNVANITDGTTTYSTEYMLNDVVSGTAKAWLQYDGQYTFGVHQSFNISSGVDNGVGKYDWNLTSNLANEGSAWSLVGQYSGTFAGLQAAGRALTTKISLNCGSNTTANLDWNEASAGCMGDLA